MGADLTLDDQIEQVLKTTRRIALVGASNKPDRPSYGVMQTLLAHGYQVTPVNPGLAGQSIQGQTVVASLQEAAPLDMVDVFRASDSVGPVVEDAIRLGAKSVWMQVGVVNQEAATAGRAAGLTVIMDRCPKIELPRLGMRGFRADAG
jgi:predicted CoA-binding protein